MTTEDDDTETAQDRANYEWFYRKISLPFRRGIVRGLLLGNDTQCFTTEQYAEAYKREFEKLFKSKADPYHKDWAETHLRTVGIVKEVAPGIWGPAT